MGYTNSLRGIVPEFVSDVTHREFRLAVLVAAGTIPFTIYLSWGRSGSSVVGIPLVLAGLVVGVLYGRRSIDARRAGAVAGLVASVGVLGWQLWYLTTTAANESTIRLLGIVLSAPLVAVIGIALSVLIVSLSAVAAGWVTVRLR